MTDEEQPAIVHSPGSVWVHLLRLVLCFVLFAGLYVVVGFIVGFGRMQTDWYPVDNSRVATNVLAGFVQVGVAAIITFIFYRPASSWLVGKFHKHLHLALHHHRTLQAAERKEEHQALHDRLEAIENHLKGEQSLG